MDEPHLPYPQAWWIPSMPCHPIFLRYISISFHLCLGLPRDLFTQISSSKPCTHTYFLPHTHHTLCSSHSHWFHTPDNMWGGIHISTHYAVLSILSYFPPLGPNILLSPLFLKYFQPTFSLHVTDQVSFLHRKTGKIIVLPTLRFIILVKNRRQNDLGPNRGKHSQFNPLLSFSAGNFNWSVFKNISYIFRFYTETYTNLPKVTEL
jgi:hypothetical protein